MNKKEKFILDWQPKSYSRKHDIITDSDIKIRVSLHQRFLKDLDQLINSVKEDCAKPLLKALKEIAKGEGRFNIEPLRHAENTIEDMKEIAEKAIRDSKE